LPYGSAIKLLILNISKINILTRKHFYYRVLNSAAVDWSSFLESEHFKLLKNMFGFIRLPPMGR
jgi:hypothetical protein